MLQAIELRSQNQWLGALACLDQALLINPRFALLQVDRALALAELGRFEEALDGFDHFLRYAPLPEVEVLRQEMLQRAFAVLGERLTKRADDLAAWLERASLYYKTCQYPQALEHYAEILKLDAGHVDALNCLGTTLLALNQHREAALAYQRALSSSPRRAELWYNLGNVLQQSGCLEQARLAYRMAIKLVPDFAEAHMEIGHCWLLAGQHRGWADLEWRWRSGALKGRYLESEQPLWLGVTTAPPGRRLASPCLSGKTILLWAEQGAGDVLQFVRFAPRLCLLAERVILRLPNSLRRLLERLDPRLQVIGDDQPLPPHDVHCPLMSLPLALEIDQVFSSSPYLRADADMVVKWRHILGEKHGLRVGIVWAGRQFGVVNYSRDLPLSALLPISSLNMELISLQKEISPLDTDALRDMPNLRCFAELLDDYSETAALIANLDLVIAVDTSVAHLAASMGKPCWLMLRYGSEWRWQRDRRDSPWYLSLVIFRQVKAGDWNDVIARVRDELLIQLAVTGSASTAANDLAPVTNSVL